MGRVGASCLLSLAVACGGGDPRAKSKPAAKPAAISANDRTTADLPAATYAGSQTCVPCHEAEAQAWTGSHHDRAMQQPSPQTVLGTFDGTELTHGKETFRFEHEGSDYSVTVTDPGGTKTYPVRYTFGVEPLQQFLVDVGQGRLQALLAAWDSRAESEGGQRWFHLQPDDYAPPGDPLHWVQPVYNWNASCAACHSTAVVKGYDPQTKGYDTTFAEIDVGCESCHGPGSKHVESAKGGAREPIPFSLKKPEARKWVPAPGGLARLEGVSGPDPELERCAPCHARRSQLGEGDEAFHDTYRLSGLDEGLYFANGQIDDEVFVYGSFLQSRMHVAGVVCSDCHEPHSLKLRAEGNALCNTCHATEVFDTPKHHFHPADSPGAQCGACHMPQRTYMVIDDRADHRLGVPQPLVSAMVGAPDPCLGCHEGWTAKQADDAIAKHLERKPRAAFAGALHAARSGGPDAAAKLLEVMAGKGVPAIARATALTELGRYPSPKLVDAIKQAARDPDPLLRRAAASLAGGLPPPMRAPLAVPLLGDETRSVRIEAAAALVGTDPRSLPPEQAKRFRDALAEYRKARQLASDRADGLVDLANLSATEGDLDAARSMLESAIAIEPAFVAAHVNLADVYRAQRDEAKAEETLRAALKVVVDPAPVRHALGLTLVRNKKTDAALAELRAAHELRPEVVRYGYVYGVALFDAGQQDDALRVLRSVHDRHPGDAQVLEALAQYAAKRGQTADAERYRSKLTRLQGPAAPGR